MIFIGYQGIGKSTLAGANNFIDLESGNFWITNKETGCADRADNWYIPYCQIAEHLSAQGYHVFVSSHEVVRKQLRNSKEKVVIIYPSLELKDKWIEKLKDRWERTQLVKDYKAYMNALDRYTENINELMSEEDFGHLIIHKMSYDLNWTLATKFDLINEEN